MPQSLMVSGGSSSNSAVKRQRSTDGRDVQARPVSTGRNVSNGSLAKMNLRIPNYLDKSKAEISQAFQDLEWKQRFRLFHALENPASSPFRVDRSEVVINRNRYGNVQPWDNSRVKLKTPLDGSDYVNASPIVLKSRGVSKLDDEKSGDRSGKIFQDSRYVSTQGPKELTASHFWHMVMQETIGDTGVVVMLTQCYEANKEKCSQYYPADMTNPTFLLSNSNDSDEDKENLDERGVSRTVPNDTVTLKSISNDTQTSSQVRVMTLTINNKSKTIYHYLFHGWPDFGKPEAEDRLALLELTRQSKKIAGDSPRIVHCSAGVGRTGTFIALDFLVREIEEGRLADTKVQSDENNPTRSSIYTEVLTPTTETWGRSGPPKVNTPTTMDFPSTSGEDNQAMREDLIYETVNTLREQRMMMVMNELQYSFLYEVVREVFMEKYRARPEGAVVKGPEGESVDLPKGKVARVEGEDDDAGDGGSASEAETEIMEGGVQGDEKETDAKTDVEGDPYDVVAPQHIREGIAKAQE